MASKTQNLVFFHPDLGIGGAERLVIDAAVGLQNRGHRVIIFTSHCDPKHCFDEARDGTLDVRVRGNSVVPPNILGRFAILCAILRQLHLILQICVLSSELQRLNPTAFLIDQLSAGIPLLRILQPKPRILFYCHFPDKLLAKKGGLIKSIYRWPFDWIESWSTGCSDGIVVNSKFTKSVFKEAFPRLKDRTPGVIYPCVDTQPRSKESQEDAVMQPLWEGTKFVLSINRFERKKDVGLALRAFARISPECRKTSRLVVAGGYDQRVAENVSYHNELSALAEKLGLSHATAKTVVSALAIPANIDVLFLLSVPGSFKGTLLSSASLLVYTPLHEHFGIVPLEAMLAGIPVLAANEGGPTETVVDGKTGWLRDVENVEDWASIMESVLDGSIETEVLTQMGEDGRTRVKELFSKEKMAASFEAEINSIMSGRRPPVFSENSWTVGLIICGGLVHVVVCFALLYIL